MRVLRPLVLLSLVACGGFLPFIGDDDDDDGPPAPPSSDAATEAASDGSITGLVDGANDAVAPGDCRQLKGECSLASDCCSGLECRAAACCVSGGQYANAAADCCSGMGEFASVAGWLCVDDT